MTSKIKRRSGKAVAEYCELIGWRPDWVFHVGIGLNHEETDVFQEQWPDCKFAGCEPHPQIVETLQKLQRWKVEGKRYGEASVYPGMIIPYAVGSKKGTAVLHTKSKHKDGSSLFLHSNRNPKNKYGEVEVNTVPLDGITGPFGSDMLLWSDCEGSELNALKGGERFLRSVGMVNVEMSCRPLGDGWCRPLDVHQLLHRAGFAQAWCHTNRIHAGQFDSIYVRREMLKPELCMCLEELYLGKFVT